MNFTRLATPDERAANQRAIARLFKLFPRLPKSDVGDFLINCTAYPMCSLQDAVEQAATLSRRVGKSVQRAYYQVDKDVERGMRYVRRKYPEHFK